MISKLIEFELENCKRLKALLVYRFEVRFGTMLFMYTLEKAGKRKRQQRIFQSLALGGGELPIGNFTTLEIYLVYFGITSHYILYNCIIYL